jgi:hypothetical protein
LSATLTAGVIHRVSSRAVRHAPFWDCGYPGAGPVAQYSAASLSQPIRRVFGTIVFYAHEEIDMPAPGDIRPAKLRRFISDPIWDYLYAPIARVVGAVTSAMNVLQFLTIRRYLGFVFITLVVLLVVLTIWG